MRVYQFRHVGTGTALAALCYLMCLATEARILREAISSVNSRLRYLFKFGDWRARRARISKARMGRYDKMANRMAGGRVEDGVRTAAHGMEKGEWRGKAARVAGPADNIGPEMKKRRKLMKACGVFCVFGRWCPRRDSNPHTFTAHGPEPCASTNSATWALLLQQLLLL
jgi:hypothetical protein